MTSWSRYMFCNIVFEAANAPCSGTADAASAVSGKITTCQTTQKYEINMLADDNCTIPGLSGSSDESSTNLFIETKFYYCPRRNG
jgi:hypothetical protein